MANVKISALPAATTPLAGSELFEVVQSGVSRSVAASAIGNSATAVPYTSVAGRAHCIAYNSTDVTFAANTPTVIEFDTAGIEVGITVENNPGGDPTRITFAEAGTYEIALHAQFDNTDSSNRIADIWFRLNGTDIPFSTSEISVPKVADGGTTFFQVQGIVAVTAGQYIEVVVAVSNVAVSLDYTAAITSPYNRPSIPSALIVAQRIA
jgi:hypothetical protein